MDFKNYQSQLRTLIPLRKEPDFNELINKVFFGESTSDKFLLKMELNRLAQPCARIIDLRDKVSEKTSPFKYKQLEHHLTPSANTSLKNAIELFGEYTVGAFEMVHQHVQKEKQQQAVKTNVKKVAKNNNNITESIQLNNHNRRAAPRMFFVSPVTITLDSGEQHQASTVNISVSGLKLKLTKNPRCLNNSSISITFAGLLKEYKDADILLKKINYRLIKQEEENNAFYFYLSLDVDNVAFIDFTQSFIRNNQYKYKMDVHYYFHLARENALKNSTLKSINTLPIYLNANAPSPILFMLENEVNKKIISDWHCNKVNQLTFLFSELRILRLLEFSKTQSATTLYSFTYINNGVEYLLSATEEELNVDHLKQLFIEYGQSQLNWRRYHLTLEPYVYQANQEHEVTAIKPKIFNKITHIATLTELTTTEIIETDTRQEKQTLKLLNKFVNRNSGNEQARIFKLFPNEHRKEERYSYSSAIKLTQDKETISGKIVDFSYSGLKVKLDQVTSLIKRSIVKIDFIELQKLSQQYSLMGVEYRVIGSSSGNIYHLQVASQECFVAIHNFFTLLVKNNSAHFSMIPLKEAKQPVTARLHEIAESSLNQALFFISSVNGRPRISYSSIAPTAVSLNQLFSLDCDNDKQHNYQPISNNHLLDRLIFTPVRNSLKAPINFEQTVYVKKIKNKNNQWFLSSYLDEDFSSEESKRQFIKEHKSRGQLQILHYRLSTIKTPDLNVVRSEIVVISRYAMHLTKRIEEELLNVNGMIEIIDRTDQILSVLNEK
ncbi:PilZ domain-containing protein [Psychromonas sp.]|nr:PilZ domain-containing protein [Psychromonas sp.]